MPERGQVNKPERAQALAPKGAIVNSQGRKPLDRATNIISSPNGATETLALNACRPFGANDEP